MLILFILIQIKNVQVFVAKRAAIYLSERLHTRVHIGSVDIQFFKKLVLEDVYIEDQHHDTLLYAKGLKLRFRTIDLKKHKINIAGVELLSTKYKLIQYHGEQDFNHQFILDAFITDTATRSANVPWDIKFDEVKLINTDFTYRSEDDTLITTGVNYYDLRTSSVNAKIKNIRFDKDTIFGNIIYLSALEKSGFILQEFSGNTKISPAGLQVDDLVIKTPNSHIATDLSFNYSGFADFREFNDSVYFKALFNQSKVGMSDIAFFAPQLYGLNQKIILSGKITGKVSDMRGKNMQLLLDGTTTHFKGDIKLKGLPDIEQTAIYLNIDQLNTSYRDLTKIPVPPFTSNKKLDIPLNFAKLGNVKFKGTFAGLYNDFYAYGKFTTAVGILSSDISLSRDDLKNKSFYQGSVKTIAFDFGTFFGLSSLGKITANVAVNGSGFTIEDVAANLNGTIQSLDFNKYIYKNIGIEGDVAHKVFNGKLTVKDDNIDFDFVGNVDFTRKLPTLNFSSTVHSANLSALNFVDPAKNSNLSTQLEMNVTGSNIDNLIGSIQLSNTIYKQGKYTYKLNSFNLESQLNNGSKALVLQSDVMDAQINGHYKLLDLPLTFERFLSLYLPAYFQSKVAAKKIESQEFSYSVQFKNSKDILHLLAPDLSISPRAHFEGNFNSITNQLALNGEAPSIGYSNFVLKNFKMNATANNTIELKTGAERFYISDSSWLDDFKIVSTAKSDSVDLTIKWDNNPREKTKGNMKATVLFSPDAVLFKVLPSEFVVSDSVWVINKYNQVVWDSTAITISDLKLEHDKQSIALDGKVSANKDDRLKLILHDFNLANLNVYTKSAGFEFKGSAEGESSITDLYHKPVFVSNNTFNNVYVNGNKVGNGTIASVWNSGKEALYMHGSFTLGIVPNVLFSGNYYPKKEADNIDMELSVQALQMNMFQPLVKDYCSDFLGFVSGNVSMKGTLKEPKFNGVLNVNAKKVKVNYLNTIYNFSHDIIIDNNSFGVEEMPVYDINHNKALVSGKVYHENFKNFQLDFDLQPHKFMILNTTEADNNLYYGKAYVSGIANISGYLDNILIEAKVKTEALKNTDRAEKINFIGKAEGTKFFIPLSETGEISDEDGFIKFIKKDNVVKTTTNQYKVNLDGLKMNFDLEVTPDAEVQLIFDQRMGDIITTQGSGNIKLNIDTKGDFKMYGDYAIESGDYLFTLKNLINKKFDIQKGSTIKWTGVPYKADLNINTIYKTRASLSPFQLDSNNSNSQKRVLIDLGLLMTGNLLSPDINFNINMPTVDGDTRQKVLSYIDNETEMNRQVFSLLILSSFITPAQLSNAGINPNMGAVAGANTSELLSNQLSNMLRNVSNDFDVGINYRPGDAVSKDELEVALSTQLFNNKLSIDGNLGVNNNNSQTTNNIVGDVNVDYKLTDDGKLRVKAFNKTNDITNQLLSQGPYTQGVGAFYREEFDTIEELYKRYLKKIKGEAKK